MLPSNKVVDNIQILIDQAVVKQCDSVNKCLYTAGPYLDKAGLSIHYGALVTFTDNTEIFSGYTFIEILDKASITFNFEEDSVGANDTNSVSSFVWPAEKPFSSVQMYVNGELAGTCFAVKCIITVGPYPDKGGSNVSGYAIANFLDNTKLKSASDSFYVEPAPEPSVAISLSPAIKGLYNYNDLLTFTATADKADKTITRLEIILQGIVAKMCAGVETCSLSKTAKDVINKMPIENESFTYQARVRFSDQTSLTTSEYTRTVLGLGPPL